MRQKLLFTILLLCLSQFQTVFAQETMSFEHDGLERSYTINLPDNYDEETPTPLLIALHGFGSDGLNLQEGTQIDEIANESGFIAVFPDGYQAGWNFLDENQMEQGENWTDDVGFITALTDRIIEDYNVNTRRIYLVGVSNGALMALRMGCEMDERLAGVAAVMATYSFELAEHCADAEVIPTILVWGTEDEVFPATGYVLVSPNNIMRSSFSVNQTRTYLRSRYQCPNDISPTVAHSEESEFPIQREVLTGCASGVPALLYLIVGESHVYPKSSKIILLSGESNAPIEMTFFEVFNNIQRPE